MSVLRLWLIMDLNRSMVLLVLDTVSWLKLGETVLDLGIFCNTSHCEMLCHVRKLARTRVLISRFRSLVTSEIGQLYTGYKIIISNNIINKCRKISLVSY